MLNKDNTHVIAPIMFYENRKAVLFKVFGSVTYFIIDKYVCLDYLCLRQKSLHVKTFQNFTFDDIYGIGILELLMNIIYCRGFAK